MYLSNRDIKWAIECGQLIVDPRPEELIPSKGYDETSIDLHLGSISTAMIWDLDKLRHSDKARGFALESQAPEVRLGSFDFEVMAKDHLKPVPEGDGSEGDQKRLVYRRGSEIIVHQLGFLLWSTKEEVGTPKVDPGLYVTSAASRINLLCKCQEHEGPHWFNGALYCTYHSC